VDPAELRARCETRLADLRIPNPFDLTVFCADLAQRRGRPIALLPMPLAGAGLSGLWLRADRTDYVVYEQATTRLHQTHIALHEIGHLLCEHQSVVPLTQDHLRDLFPSLDPRMVHTALGRAGYSNDEENEAEMIASLILERTRVKAPPAKPANSVPTPVAQVLRRLEDSL
jgi:hypothetical protein